jgi:hypothetical protein
VLVSTARRNDLFWTSRTAYQLKKFGERKARALPDNWQRTLHCKDRQERVNLANVRK